jgi:hypothetical protein
VSAGAPCEVRRGPFLVTTDRARFDVDVNAGGARRTRQQRILRVNDVQAGVRVSGQARGDRQCPPRRLGEVDCGEDNLRRNHRGYVVTRAFAPDALRSHWEKSRTKSCVKYRLVMPAFDLESTS